MMRISSGGFYWTLVQCAESEVKGEGCPDRVHVRRIRSRIVLARIVDVENWLVLGQWYFTERAGPKFDLRTHRKSEFVPDVVARIEECFR